MIFLYNLLELKRTIWEGPELAPAKHTMVFEYKPQEPGLGKGGTDVAGIEHRYDPPFRFTGKINWVNIKLGAP